MIFGLLLLATGLAVLPFAAEAVRPKMADSARQTAPGQFAELSQGLTHFEWFGPARGPVAVCIHGLTTPSFVWRGVARGLALMGYRVLTYDLYGRGYSDRPRGLQTEAFFLRQLDDLLSHQGLGEDLTVIGYSMGGAIATCFCARDPHRIRRMILIAPAGLGIRANGLTRFVARTPVIGDWLMLMLYPFLQRRGVEAERGLPSSVPDIVDLQIAELRLRGYIPAVLASLRGILGNQLETQHRKLDKHGVPVVAIWGREDDVIPLTAAGTLAQWNRGALQEVIEGAGHGLTYTHTDQILAAIRAAVAADLATS